MALTNAQYDEIMRGYDKRSFRTNTYMTSVLRKPIARRPASGKLTQRLHPHLSGRRTGLWMVMRMLSPLYALQSRTIRRSVLLFYPHSDIRLIILILLHLPRLPRYRIHRRSEMSLFQAGYYQYRLFAIQYQGDFVS